MMMRSKRAYFEICKLLHCQTIEQCLMLDADVHNGGGDETNADKGRGRKTDIFADVLYGRSLMARAIPVLCNKCEMSAFCFYVNLFHTGVMQA